MSTNLVPFTWNKTPASYTTTRFQNGRKLLVVVPTRKVSSQSNKFWAPKATLIAAKSLHPTNILILTNRHLLWSQNTSPNISKCSVLTSFPTKTQNQASEFDTEFYIDLEAPLPPGVSGSILRDNWMKCWNFGMQISIASTYYRYKLRCSLRKARRLR